MPVIFRVPGCRLYLGDRSISITLHRMLASLSLWQKIRFGLLLMQELKPIRYNRCLLVIEQLSDNIHLCISVQGSFTLHRGSGVLSYIFVEDVSFYMLSNLWYHVYVLYGIFFLFRPCSQNALNS